MDKHGRRVRRRTFLAAVAAGLLGASSRAEAQVVVVPVQWTNVVKAAASGAALQKTGTCGSCPDAGATSAQTIQGTDGYVEFVPGTGTRSWVGLGASATADTSPALIDFAFSFWPDGGWDIRERNVYRTEGRFVAGDVFRVALVAGRVKYSRNGAVVYSSAVTPALPLVVDVTLLSIGARVVSAGVTAAAPAEPPPPPLPTVYDATSDRAVRPKGATPPVGGAGSILIDPAFGTRIARLTDASTRPLAPGRSYRTPSSTHSNAWSADGRYFYAVSTDGTIVPFAFDAAAMKAARVPAAGSADGALTLRFANEPSFSYTTAGVLYGTYSGSGANKRSVDEYRFATGQYTPILNLDTVVPNLTGVAGSVLVSGGPVERIVTFFGGASQDRHTYLLAFDRDNPARRHLVDTLASTIDGLLTDVPLNFRIHAASIDRSGRFVIVYPTAVDLAAPRKAAPVYVWDLTAGTFTPVPLAAGHSGGHDAYGYGVRVNQDCCSSSTWDAAQWQFRSLANPLLTFDLIAPVLQPKEVLLADHPSWHNARPDRMVPFVDANYRYGANTTAWRPWDEEIIAVQTDAPGTGGAVWRFAHHRSLVANDANPSRIYFWYTPRPNVSPDGRWALFTSNWDKTLGIDPRGEAGGAARQDVFVVELRVR